MHLTKSTRVLLSLSQHLTPPASHLLALGSAWKALTENTEGLWFYASCGLIRAIFGSSDKLSSLVSYYYYVIEAAVVSDVSKVYAQPLLASYHMPESKWTVSQWSNKVNKLDFAHGSDQPKMFKIP